MAAQYSMRSSAAQGSTTMTQSQRSAGSRTATVASVTTQIQPVLVLRPDNTAGENTQDDGQGQRRRGIRWAENVVDNEGLGRKKSKVCCIYHAPRPIDESSDESSSDSSSSDESGSEPDNSSARPSKKAGHARDHEHGKGCGDGHGKKPKPRQRSPNAYEKMPKAKDGGSGGGKERS